MNHTPGPWEVQKLNHVAGDPWYQIGHDGRGPIARINCTAEPMPKGVVAELKYLVAPEEEQVANARLISAAPELLEACESFVKAISGEMYFHSDIQVKAVAAIKKAKG